MTEVCVENEAEIFTESEEEEDDCHSNNSVEDYEDSSKKFSDDFLSKKIRCNFRSLIKSSDTSMRTWNIDKTRRTLLKRLMLLPIGKHSFEVLSKFVINHQILEIVRVLKAGSCVDLQVKVNLESQNFSGLKSENVIIKIFQDKSTYSTDMENAKKFCGIVCSKDRQSKPIAALPPIYYYHYSYNANIEILTIFRVGHIVFTKMIGNEKPAPNITQLIKSNPKKREDYLIEFLRLLKGNANLWLSPASTKSILWHDNQFMIIHSLKEKPKNLETFYLSSNIYATLKIFLRFGVPRSVVLSRFNEVFPPLYHEYYYSNRFFYDVSLKINEKFKC